MNILDFYTHGGAQYELFKLNHTFYMMSPNGTKPKWDSLCRPMPNNLVLLDEFNARKMKFDKVIVRSPVNNDKYDYFIKRGAEPISVVQTTNTYAIPKECKKVVWNCEDVMNKYSKAQHKNYYIVHGFDPDEFKKINIIQKPRVLTVANAFKKRAKIMGYPMWDKINMSLGICDVVGHDNININPNIKQATSFDELVNIYNSYQVFLNTTIESAMPRSRGEAAMCGMAICTTNNFDIGKYFSNKKDILYINSDIQAIDKIKYLLDNKSYREDLGLAARETAIKHFHIKDYLSKWEEVLS